MTGTRARLLLADGTPFEGEGFGPPGWVKGEAVFFTGMTGYEEALTDPSYAGQILVFCYPLIGNYGIDPLVRQHKTVCAAGAVCKRVSRHPSHYRNAGPLLDWLSDSGVPLIEGVDTRALVTRLREAGTMRAVLATGDELVMPGSTPGPGQIVYSNGYALRALARAEGAETIDLGIAADTVEATTEGIRRARDSGADILITTGGASVGDHDLVKQSLEAEGVTMAFWRIAMRPGKPMMHGRLGAMRVIGLPGNPVSSYVCAFLFLEPLIRRLGGRSDLSAPTESALLGCDLPANDERVTDIIRLGRNAMPGYSQTLSSQDIQDLLAYLHTL